MSHKVLILFMSGEASTSSVMDFDSLSAANQAKKQFDDKNAARGKWYIDRAFCEVFSNPPTVKSLFKEMIKANPYGNVKEIMTKAEEAIKILEAKTLDEI